jgi:hypothetical protein
VHAAIRAGLLSPLRPSVPPLPPPRRDDWLSRARPGNGAGPQPRRRVGRATALPTPSANATAEPGAKRPEVPPRFLPAGAQSL